MKQTAARKCGNCGCISTIGRSDRARKLITFSGCIECIRCRLLLPVIAVSFSLSLARLNSAARSVCVVSFGAAFAKSLWPLVSVAFNLSNS